MIKFLGVFICEMVHSGYISNVRDSVAFRNYRKVCIRSLSLCAFGRARVDLGMVMTIDEFDVRTTQWITLTTFRMSLFHD